MDGGSGEDDSGEFSVELADLEAEYEEEVVQLRWETASEIDNAGFAVERSTNEQVFEQIGCVEGQGTTTRPQTYKFADEDVPYAAEHIYYRLKQVGLDGTYEYVETVEVVQAMPENFVLQENLPDPFQQTTTIRYQLPKAEHVELKVYDALGREVTTLVDEEQEPGRKEVHFRAGSLSGGSTFIACVPGAASRPRR